MATPRSLAPALAAAALVAGAPAAAQQKDEPPALGLLETINERDWTISIQVQAVDTFRINRLDGQPIAPQRLNRILIVFPLLEFTSTYRALDAGFESELRIIDDVVDDEAELLPLYQAGARLAKWDATGDLSTDFFLQINQTGVSRSVSFDEDAAEQVGWPELGWPAIAATALEPQFFVDNGAPAVQQRLDRWVGPNPRRMAPVTLAKTLAAKMINEFRIVSGLSIETSSVAGIGGYIVAPASFTAPGLKGSQFDMSVLLCALYRQAGLPARVVIGFDLGASAESVDEIAARGPYEVCQLAEPNDLPRIPIIRSWVEFYLYDEDAQAGEWIPVDPWRQQQISSRARPLNQRWDFFGNQPCGDLLIPLAFHFVPPTTVASPGAPALWGWLGFPVTPRIEHNFNVGAFATPRRPGD